MPIVLYSSELKLAENNQGVYSHMNMMLRSQDIWKYSLEKLKSNWCFKFIGTLKNHLSKIKCQKIKLYHGS